ncbi:hypothetical protein V1T75_11645 [Tenacibaculum sp. FZY0031]|uniref:M61 family metallopeptidase n=1 Tax=Tenacibaculum sp. FZY0031 TaxID=3116648 RepID=UPI002EBE3264|nr:hypothetical protein [Tenacibaculum sp. FZY0031]
MKNTILLIFTFIFLNVSFAQNTISYTLNHTPNSNKITVELAFDNISTNGIKLIIPRSAPGTYELTNYIAFINNVKGYTSSGNILKGVVGDGSFFTFNEKDQVLKRISYEVDINKMEMTFLKEQYWDWHEH